MDATDRREVARPQAVLPPVGASQKIGVHVLPRNELVQRFRAALVLDPKEERRVFNHLQVVHAAHSPLLFELQRGPDEMSDVCIGEVYEAAFRRVVRVRSDVRRGGEDGPHVSKIGRLRQGRGLQVCHIEHALDGAPRVAEDGPVVQQGEEASYLAGRHSRTRHDDSAVAEASRHEVRMHHRGFRNTLRPVSLQYGFGGHSEENGHIGSGEEKGVAADDGHVANGSSQQCPRGRVHLREKLLARFLEQAVVTAGSSVDSEEVAAPRMAEIQNAQKIFQRAEVRVIEILGRQSRRLEYKGRPAAKHLLERMRTDGRPLQARDEHGRLVIGA